MAELCATTQGLWSLPTTFLCRGAPTRKSYGCNCLPQTISSTHRNMKRGLTRPQTSVCHLCDFLSSRNHTRPRALRAILKPSGVVRFSTTQSISVKKFTTPANATHTKSRSPPAQNNSPGSKPVPPSPEDVEAAKIEGKLQTVVNARDD